MTLKIEYVSINELKTYENNAKLHPAEQIEQIKKSIEQFGMNDPIAIWKDNVIIEGHGRLIACLELGMEEVPVIRLDSLTDEQRRAYTLIHNKITMNSGFDLDVLSDEMDNIFDIDMSEFGFNVDDGAFLDDLLENEMADLKSELTEFAVTFNFPVEKEKQIKEYLKNCRENVLNYVIQESEKYA